MFVFKPLTVLSIGLIVSVLLRSFSRDGDDCQICFEKTVEESVRVFWYAVFCGVDVCMIFWSDTLVVLICG